MYAREIVAHMLHAHTSSEEVNAVCNTIVFVTTNQLFVG